MCVVIPSVAKPLDALPLLHGVFGDRIDRIYRVQGSLELSFFRVIVNIRFKLTRNGIISVRSVNLIVIVIDGTVQHRRKPYDALHNMKAPSLLFEYSRDWDPYLERMKYEDLKNFRN
ncbi:hypothetical protein M9H77_21328 [Catharanthus roseus]|uniref:Uncharacterized protein n=1 Tax=Catharanthus roseus TaxID=4058 RepID=A0ACC0AMA4_CATRO|nr:hypothetical protein M9H77_21328 [Catharanthus roseus]